MAKKIDPQISKYFSKQGKKGGKLRWKDMTPEERSKHGQMMRSKRGQK